MEKLHVQPSELDRLPYYELEYTIDEYNQILKDRNENSNTQPADVDKYNAGNLMSRAQSSLKNFKAPKMPTIKLPSM